MNATECVECSTDAKDSIWMEFEVELETYSRPARSPMYLQQFPLKKPRDWVPPKAKKAKPPRGKGRRKKK
jgi:hypothetical protein